MDGDNIFDLSLIPLVLSRESCAASLAQLI